jgi:hypothetical protein
MILEKKRLGNWYILSVLILVLAALAACEGKKSPAFGTSSISGTSSTSGAANSASAEAARTVEQANVEAAKAIEQASAEAAAAVEAVQEETDLDALTQELNAALNAASSLAGAAGSSSSSSGGDRKAIDDFLKSYEEFVAEAEKAKGRNDPMAMLPLVTKSADLGTKASQLQSNTAWTAADAAKYTALSARAVKALQ